MQTLRRELQTSVRVLDSRKGIAEFVASDQTVDSYREVIRADGWRFSAFKRNAPVCDSHDYSSIDKLLGKVIDYKVERKQLIETIQLAIDVPQNTLAQLAWRMLENGYLRSCSVGFFPVRAVRPGDSDWTKQLKDLGLPTDARVNAIYTEQEQVELSLCIIGSNPNALAKAHVAGVLSFDEFSFLHRGPAPRDTYSRNERAVGEMLAMFRRPPPKRDAVGEMLSHLRSKTRL